MAKQYRQGRIGEEIRRIISEMLLSDLKDPRLAPAIAERDFIADASLELLHSRNISDVFA